MNYLNPLERNILEVISQKSSTFTGIVEQTGISKLICQKILQDLIEKKAISTNGTIFQISREISPELIQELNSEETLSLEALEYIETILEFRKSNIFKFKKIAISENDYKLFCAMLANLDSFLKDAEKSFKRDKEYKNQKIIFWGAGDLQSVTNQMLKSAI